MFDRIWKEIIQVDIAAGQVAIYDTLKGESLLEDLLAVSDAPKMTE